MTLSSKDKTPNPSGWGFTFHHTKPQRRLRVVSGDLLVPASADDLPAVPAEHVATVEKALLLIAELLSDRDHQLFMGGHKTSDDRADAESATLRRIVSTGAIRSVLNLPHDQLTDDDIKRLCRDGHIIVEDAAVAIGMRDPKRGDSFDACRARVAITAKLIAERTARASGAK